MEDHTERARTYYRALDGHDYELLASLLAPEFVHERPDMTLDGRERFVEFMRDERPVTETRHEIRTTFTPDGAGSTRVAAEGRLLDAEDVCLTGFVDVFTLDGGQISRIETYVDGVVDPSDRFVPDDGPETQ
jgi:ketosteroid isomerase-like protein